MLTQRVRTYTDSHLAASALDVAVALSHIIDVPDFTASDYQLPIHGVDTTVAAILTAGHDHPHSPAALVPDAAA